MRRTPTSDTITATLAHGATARPGFDNAFRELAAARAAYDAALGNPDLVPDLAVAAARLDAARRSMATLQHAA